MELQHGKYIRMDNVCFYEDEFKVKPTVRINALKKTLKIVGIVYITSSDCHRTSSLGYHTLLFINNKVESLLRPRFFAELPKSLPRRGLKHAMKRDIMKKKTNWKREKDEEVE